ncbi:MAG: hypothetical protein J7L78_04030 [Dehalococcoidales bacterium]|nr:hypothetical protein [Dehalococcoidales bacterium]
MIGKSGMRYQQDLDGTAIVCAFLVKGWLGDGQTLMLIKEVVWQIR